mmetsp:Transcript_115321/g.311719  ORF Transcript_115321/g.311719 Transcript_115321/m.311719 type:complete len:194 (+) Transcript_115321:84-665(+)|eukprot:CAMPEP_0177186440 /NCGR_PEP_ID=MMETSP0367-20130122/18647_1 /TAXON_ID=447022 ORGANISM="Scrippsiella hangoei-like, Strain SHHI-4" /NCGR_SAMPLE_ID=MMETSP0367 /ASSEMBLY_ACC=CAM_ASM_000362 /LENGTH=193 /DNA_ID=CAMNT_0018633733 /DNA_START=83 /DNA_END=664 /DNA_ORIENTATION=+
MAPRRNPVSAVALSGLACAALWWSSRSSSAVDSGAFVGAQAVRRLGLSAGSAGVQSEAGVARQFAKVDAIVASLKELTLLEASELVKAIEETFGVDASASGGGMMMMAAPAAGAGEEVEEKVEKTEFDLILKEVPKDKKIAVIKVVRTMLELGLKEAKEKVDEPGKLMEGKPKNIVEEGLKLLLEAGAKAEIV